MTKKAELLALLERCDDVVDREFVNLGAWEAASSPGRAASCRQAAMLIAIGDHCPKARVAAALARANALADAAVHRPPAPARAAQADALIQNVAPREGQDPDQLDDTPFAQALLDAQLNARDAADLAEVVLAECTA